MQFVAIDVETANADMASVCQIGIVQFAGGFVSNEWKTYIDPEDYFDDINVSIHGIDASVAVGAPTFRDVSDRINGYLNGQVVVTHTQFDRTAVHQAASKWQVHPPNCTWLDSARIARRAWIDLAHSGYGLAKVCEHIRYKFKHHDALEDAKAAGQIVIAAMAETGLDINGWLNRVQQPLDPRNTAERITREANPDGQLYGEIVVFTGALQIPRREAADLAAAMGCKVDANVTHDTSLLVVGDQDLTRLAGHNKSNKHRKAEELIRIGQNIRILRETDFRQLFQLSIGDGARFCPRPELSPNLGGRVTASSDGAGTSPLSLGALFGERRITPPPGFGQGGASLDSPDMCLPLDGAEELGPLVGVRLAITYAYDDTDASRTRRFVVVDKAVRRGRVWYLQAYCELRGSLRAFRVDRIREIMDTRTGEVHKDPAKFLSGLLVVARGRGARRRTRTNPTERLIAESQHGLTVLLYFAQSDQKLNRGEKRILWNYLEWQQDRCSIEGRVTRRPFNSWMDALVPDTEQFAAALQKLLESEKIHAHYVLARVPEIVMADGCADDEEKKRLRTLLELVEQPVPANL